MVLKQVAVAAVLSALQPRAHPTVDKVEAELHARPRVGRDPRHHRRGGESVDAQRHWGRRTSHGHPTHRARHSRRQHHARRQHHTRRQPRQQRRGVAPRRQRRLAGQRRRYRPFDHLRRLHGGDLPLLDTIRDDVRMVRWQMAVLARLPREQARARAIVDVVEAQVGNRARIGQVRLRLAGQQRLCRRLHRRLRQTR